MQGCVAEMAEETYVENFACDKCKHRKGPREGAFLEERIVSCTSLLVALVCSHYKARRSIRRIFSLCI